jgi:transposase
MKRIQIEDIEIMQSAIQQEILRNEDFRYDHRLHGVLHAPTEKSMSLFGAVNVSSGKLVNLMTPIFNAETFKQFIEKLIKRGSKKKRLIVVLDNARYHHAILLKPWLHKNRQRISFLFLPPYSPELNPIERVWKMIRRNCTHNQYFPPLECLVKNVKEQVELWNTLNDVLHKLCCII